MFLKNGNYKIMKYIALLLIFHFFYTQKRVYISKENVHFEYSAGEFFSYSSITIRADIHRNIIVRLVFAVLRVWND